MENNGRQSPSAVGLRILLVHGWPSFQDYPMNFFTSETFITPTLLRCYHLSPWRSMPSIRGCSTAYHTIKAKSMSFQSIARIHHGEPIHFLADLLLLMPCHLLA